MLSEILNNINSEHRRKLFVTLVNKHSQLMADTLNCVGSTTDEAIHYNKMVRNLGTEFADNVLKISMVHLHGE